VRVIAATNRDLAQAVRERNFREDLYYRLNVVPIRIPPLRERGEDAVLLAEQFRARFARQFGRAVAPLADADRRLLLAYAWPGNVRELENVIERAVITAKDGRLDLARLLDAPAERAAPPAPDPSAILTDAELRRIERDNIARALAECGWKVAGGTGAARRLGLSPSTLASRMKALGIARPKS
jgi:transcriptional regulator with GAF, ATPase, and Fis domain